MRSSGREEEDDVVWKGGKWKVPQSYYKEVGENNRRENRGVRSGKRGCSCRLDLRELIKEKGIFIKLFYTGMTSQ